MYNSAKRSENAKKNGLGSRNKGKTYEEIYGTEKAAELKDKRRQNAIERDIGASTRGKTYEGIYSPEKAQHMREIRSGENHWYWKGGKYRRGSDWSKVRIEVLKRDKYTCQDCGATKGRIAVHHLVPYIETQDNSLDNLITVCNKCHRYREIVILKYSNRFNLREYTEEDRKLISKRMKIIWQDEERRKKTSERMIGNTFSPKNLPRDNAGRFTKEN